MRRYIRIDTSEKSPVHLIGINGTTTQIPLKDDSEIEISVELGEWDGGYEEEIDKILQGIREAVKKGVMT